MAHTLPYRLLLLSRVLMLAALFAPSHAILRMFFFGDSSLDTGNANFLRRNSGQINANLVPYGRSLTPPGPTGRFSDGKLFTDLFAERAGLQTPFPILQPSAPRSMGANLATAGAGVLNSTRTSNMTMSVQLNMFLQMATTISKAELGKETIVVLSVGVNDWLQFFKSTFFASYKNNTPSAATQMTAATVDIIRRMYTVGVRNFVVLNMGPIGCLPILRDIVFWNSGCFSDGQMAAATHNSMLDNALTVLRTQLVGSSIVLVDTFNAFNLAAASAGIPVNKGACCGYPAPINGKNQCGVGKYNNCIKPAEFMFWDYIHPTEAATGRMFNLAWSGTSVTKPFNLLALFKRMNIVPVLKN